MNGDREQSDVEREIRAVLVRALFAAGKEPTRSPTADVGEWLCPADGEAAAEMLDELVADIVARFDGEAADERPAPPATQQARCAQCGGLAAAPYTGRACVCPGGPC